MTWPVYLSCASYNRVCKLCIFAFFRTSVSGILSCHLIFRSFLRQLRWKWLSFLAWRWYAYDLMYIIVTCKYEMNLIKKVRENLIKKVRENVMTLFSHCNTFCCHGNQSSHLVELQTHSSSYACPHYLQI